MHLMRRWSGFGDFCGVDRSDSQIKKQAVSSTLFSIIHPNSTGQSTLPNMRLAFSPPPLPSEFSSATDWTRLRELPIWAMRLLVLPTSVMCVFITLVAWAKFAPWPDSELPPLHEVVLVYFAVMVAHIALQILAHPSFGLTRRTVLGLWPSRVVIYLDYDGNLSRNRFIFILVIPTLVLTIVPFLIAYSLQIRSGWMLFIACVNVMLSSGNILLAALVIFQVPTLGTIRNRVFETYWRVR